MDQADCPVSQRLLYPSPDGGIGTGLELCHLYGVVERNGMGGPEILQKPAIGKQVCNVWG